MMNAEDALRVICDTIHPIGRESVPLLQAHGRVLCRDVVSARDLPPFDNSSMDGFALRAGSLSGATGGTPVSLALGGEISAGKTWVRALKPGETVAIMTGAGIPPGADAVVPIERVAMNQDGLVTFSAHAKQGDFVRRRGEDIRKGELALRAGRQLCAPELGLLASLGVTRIPVFRRPVVHVLATGDEIVEPAGRPRRGQIRNSTSSALFGYVREAGGEPRLLGIVADDRRRLREKLRQGFRADMLLITGGASVGGRDFVKAVLSELGAIIRFSGVNIRPGRPLVFGTLGRTPFFGLPGNPVSTSVTFLQFVRPALRAMMGMTGREPMRYPAFMDEMYTKSDGKRHYLRGVARTEGGRLLVRLAGPQGSGVFSSMSKANCLVIVPEAVTTLAQGDPVELEML